MCVCVVHVAVRTYRLSQLAALCAFCVHYHMFYSGIFKSGGLGMAMAIVREQRKVLGLSGGCGMLEHSVELFSKCCPCTSWKAKRGGGGVDQASHEGRRG